MLVMIREENGKIADTQALLDCSYIGRTHDNSLKLIAKGDTIYKYVTRLNVTDKELNNILDEYTKACLENSADKCILNLTGYVFHKELQVANRR